MIDGIIPVHGNANWTKLCLLALKEHTQHELRVFIVDNASEDDETKALLDVFSSKGRPSPTRAAYPSDVHVVRLARNKSFSEAINAGMQASKDAQAGTLVVILNNDAIVTPGWDQAFVQDLADPKCALTGAQSNVASGLQSMPGLNRIFEPKWLVFLAVAAWRTTWEALGPLDADTFPWFGGEDIDYSLRALWTRAVGPDGLPRPDKHERTGNYLKVSDAYVLHAGSQTIASTLKTADAVHANNARAMGAVSKKWGAEFVRDQCKIVPTVAIGVLSRTDLVPHPFVQSLMKLRMEGMSGDGQPFQLQYLHPTRQHTHWGRELLARNAIELGADYILYLDDDMTFEPDLLKRLLAHKKDVVTAVAYQRKAPYQICVFDFLPVPDVQEPCAECDGGKLVRGRKVEVTTDSAEAIGKALGGVLEVVCAKCSGKGHILRPGTPEGGPPLEGIEHSGLRKIGWAGCAAVLIKTSVFKKLDEHPVTKDKPWWAYDAAQEDTWARFRWAVRGTSTLSELGLDTPAKKERLFALIEQSHAGNAFFGREPVGEDFWFYKQARLAGIEAFADTDVIVGHLGDTIAVDEQVKQRWKAAQKHG